MDKISFVSSQNGKLEDLLLQEPRLESIAPGRATARKLIVAGRVYVNGKRQRSAAFRVEKNQHVDIYVDRALVKSPSKRAASDFVPLRVLYEDEAVVCFDKPAGLPTQPTVDESRPNLYALALSQATSQNGAGAYLGMHHRLDRDTSGVVLFTRAEKYNAFIGEQFKEHLCAKTYVAVVHGKLKPAVGRVENFLGEVGKRGKIQKYGSVKSGGKKAISGFQVLKSEGGLSLVEVKIETGRTHQIRVHLSEMGHSVVGDTLYGSPVENYTKLGRFLLHAHALSIAHPVSKNLIRVESPIPNEFRI